MTSLAKLKDVITVDIMQVDEIDWAVLTEAAMAARTLRKQQAPSEWRVTIDRLYPDLFVPWASRSGLGTHRHIEGEYAMAKIFGVREFTLNPGIKPEDFEKADAGGKSPKPRTFQAGKHLSEKATVGNQVGY